MMKKRVFMLAVVMGMLLSVCSPVWADTYSKLNTVVAANKVKYSVNVTEGSEFNIPIQGHIIFLDGTSDGFEEGTPINITFTYEATPSEVFKKVEIVKPTMAVPTDGDPNNTNQGLHYYTTKIKGTVTNNGEIVVKGTVTIGSKTQEKKATIVFTTEKGTDVVDANFKSKDGPYDEATHVDSTNVADEANPDNDKWDGYDPTFGTSGGNGNDKPKIATSKLVFSGKGYSGTEKALKSGASADFTIEIQGPGPKIDVYVSAKDAKKLWPLSCDKKLGYVKEDWKENIRLTSADIKKWHIPFRVTSYDIDTVKSKDKTAKHTLKFQYNGAQVAYKGFPITISVENDKTGTKPVTKTYKIDIVSGKQVPQWVTPDGTVGEKLSKKNAQDISVSLHEGGKLDGVIYTVSADGPYYITSKGDKIGMSADEVIQPVLNIFGEVVSPGYVKVHGTFDNGDKGTKGGTKETKVAFTLDAVGSVKKTTFKPTVIGKVSPYFDPKNLVSGDTSYAGMDNSDREYDGYYKVKTAEAGRVPSVKFAAKGSKTITYSITEGGDELEQYGLSFDVKKGQIVQLVKNGAKVPTTATSDDGDYAPVEITVVADNGTGHTATAKALVGITGAKAKPYLGQGSDGKELKNLAIPQNSAVGTYFTIGSIVGKNVATKDSGDVNVHFRLADAKKAKVGGKEIETGEDTYALENLGLEFIPSSEFETEFDEYNGEYRNQGVIKVTGPLTATKGTKINVILSNLGNEQKGTVNIVIQDPTPVIAGPADEKGAMKVDVTKDEKMVQLHLSAGAPSNNALIEWKIVDGPAVKNNSSNFDLKIAPLQDDYTKATLTYKAKKDEAVSDRITITAKNKYSGATSEKFTVSLDIAPSGGGEGDEETPTEGQAAPKVVGHAGGKGKDGTIGETTALEDDIVTDEELTAELGEGEVTMGAERTVGMLTDAQAKVLDDGRFVIAAILPEISATADGQYGFEVDLAENVKAGAKLYWFAFPKDAPASEDDTIIDFFEINGTDTEVVPEDRIVVIYPWMRAGVTYGPVIAVKADDADSGEAVTEGELEGAAEKGTDK